MSQSKLIDPKTGSPFNIDLAQKSWVNTQEGMLNTGWDLGWWQQDRKALSGGKNEIVEACISTLSQTLSMCPAHHLKEMPDGSAERQTGSFVERVLLNPNKYTTRSLFFNNLIRSLYFYGNGMGLVTRNNNRAIDAIYLLDPRNVTGVVDPETGEVFYWSSPSFGRTFNPETDTVHADRDILNVRIAIDPKNPLKGLTPIHVAAKSIAANNSIVGHQARFFENMSRPSGILSTPDSLNKDQMTQLREAFEQASQGINSGKIPILGNGLSFESMSLSSQDAQLIEAYEMSNQAISAAFRVPPPMINDLRHATISNSEATMDWFLKSGLGFLLDHVELELGRLFGLGFNERVNFQTSALLRTDQKTQIEALKEGVTGGIFAVNEARKVMELPPVEDGDEPRMQQQMVPLSAWDNEPPEPVIEPVVEQSVTDLLTKGFSNVG